MGTTRIPDLARRLGLPTETVLALLKEMGAEVRSVLSPVDESYAMALRRRFAPPVEPEEVKASIQVPAQAYDGPPDDFPELATPVNEVPEVVRSWLNRLKSDADDHLENSEFKYREAVRDLERKGIAFALLEVSFEGRLRKYFISNSQTSWMVQQNEVTKEVTLAGFNTAPGALSVKARNHFFTSGKLPREEAIGPKGKTRVQPLAYYGLEFGDWSLLEVVETRNGERKVPIERGAVDRLGSPGVGKGSAQEVVLLGATSATTPEASVDTAEDVTPSPVTSEPSGLHERNAGLIGIHRSISNMQDEILRTRAHGVLVLTGIPGSGKTSVGLMRIAWLLDSKREENEAEDDWDPIDPKSGKPWRVDASRVVIVSRAEHLKNYIETSWNREYNYGSISVETIEYLFPSLLKNWLEWHPQDQVNPPKKGDGSESQKIRRGPLKFRTPSRETEIGSSRLGEILTPNRIDAFLSETHSACIMEWQARQEQAREELDTAHRLVIGISLLTSIRTWLREGAFDSRVKSWIESATSLHTGRNGSIEWLDLDKLEPDPEWMTGSRELGLTERVRQHFATVTNRADVENPVARALELRQFIRDWVKQNLVIPGSVRLDDLETARSRTKRLAEQLRERWPELREAIKQVRDLWKKPDSSDVDPDDQAEDEVEIPVTDERIPDPSTILAKYRSYWRRWAYANLHPRVILARFRESVLGDVDVRKRLVADGKPATSEDVYILLWLLARIRGNRQQALMPMPAPWDHIMIDEAQLYPAFQINVLLQFTSTPLFSATICGDPHQRTFKDQVQWNPEDLVPQGKAPLRCFNLQAGYRWGTELLPFFQELSRALNLPYADSIRRPDNLFLARGQRPRIQVLADNEFDPLARKLRQQFDSKRREACMGLILPGGFRWTDDCELRWALRDASIPFQHAASGREINLDPNTLLIASCDDMIGLELDHVAILHPEEILTRPGLTEDDSARHFWTVATRARLSLDLFVTEMFLESYGEFARAWIGADE